MQISSARKRPPTGWALVLATALFLPTAAAAADKYTMADLKALDEAEDWGELIGHLKDVRPSARDAKWKKMAERAAIGRIVELEKRNEKQAAFVEADRILMEVTVLKKSRAFLDKRADVGLQMYRECFNRRGGQSCLKGIEGLVNTDADNADLAFNAGRMVRLGYNASAALPFFARTVKKKDKRCTDGDLWLSVASGLALPPGKTADLAVDVAFNRCGKTMKAGVEKEFLSTSPTGYGFGNMCPPMAKAKRLSKFQKAVCADAKARK